MSTGATIAYVAFATAIIFLTSVSLYQAIR